MAEYNTGDVFLVNFDPSVGHEYKKIRPAVIIQSDKTIKKTNLISVMPITSQVEKSQDEDIKIAKNTNNGLYADSLVKVGCIHSFDRKRFLKKIGHASQEVMAKAIAYVHIHFN